MVGISDSRMPRALGRSHCPTHIAQRSSRRGRSAREVFPVIEAYGTYAAHNPPWCGTDVVRTTNKHSIHGVFPNPIKSQNACIV